MSYIVINDTLGAATVLLKKDNALWKGVPKLGILLIDEKTVTEFPSRLAANRAIERTTAYLASRKSGIKQRTPDEYLILRAIPEGLTK